MPQSRSERRFDPQTPTSVRAVRWHLQPSKPKWPLGISPRAIKLVKLINKDVNQSVTTDPTILLDLIALLL